MKLPLTSGGVSNGSIREVLVGMLGKPIADCNALCIPTAAWGHPRCTPASALAAAERWAVEIGGRAYAIDDQTAIRIRDGTTQVISEGHWKRLDPAVG